MMTLTPSRIDEIVSRIPELPILVLGDLILDRFIWGRVERISPEAPVPVVRVTHESVHLGGAANVAANLRSLGARPILVGVVGSDEPGRQFMDEMRRQGLSEAGIIRDDGRATTVKTRIIAHHQQVCRADWEDSRPVPDGVLGPLKELVESEFSRTAALILSDYDKGLLLPDLLQDTIRAARGRNLFVAVDPKIGRFSYYRSASIVTPNQRETEAASGLKIEGEESLLEAGRRVRVDTGVDSVLVTRGEEGMTLFEAHGFVHISTAAREVFDVSGAGDTVIAALTLAVAAGASLQEAAILSNHAAGVVVGKLGTAQATIPEMLQSLRRLEPAPVSPPK